MQSGSQWPKHILDHGNISSTNIIIIIQIIIRNRSVLYLSWKLSAGHGSYEQYSLPVQIASHSDCSWNVEKSLLCLSFHRACWCLLHPSASRHALLKISTKKQSCKVIAVLHISGVAGHAAILSVNTCKHWWSSASWHKTHLRVPRHSPAPIVWYLSRTKFMRSHHRDTAEICSFWVADL